MSLTPYPTLRLKLTMPQALKLQFLPAIPGTNAATAAARAEAAAADAEAAAAAATAATANKVDRTGDVMTGFLTLNADPTAGLHAATKQYVDTHSGSGGAPVAAEYITAATDAALTAERVLTDTATITWDFATPGQAKATAVASGGAPVGAEYITSSTDASLTAERVLTDTASLIWDFSTAGQAKANVLSAGQTFYFDLTDAADVATYKRLLLAPSTNAENSASVVTTGTTTDFPIASFITDPGVPGAIDYPAGSAYRRLYGSVSGGTARFRLQVYVRTVGGVETLARDEVSDNFVDTTATLQQWLATPAVGGSLGPTDRIVVKVSARRITGPTNVTVTLYSEGSAHASQVQTTVPIGGSASISATPPLVLSGGNLAISFSASSRFLGRITVGAGNAEELTGTQATTLLDVFTSTLKGLAPASGGGTSAFLRADGSWVTPSGTGSGLSDAFQIITDGTTNSVAVGAGSFRLRTTAPLTVATQNNDPTFGDNALFALANGTALSVFGVTGNASAQRADITGTAGQVLRVSGTTLAFGAIDLSVAATVGSGRLAYTNLAQGTARSVLGVTGNATADVANIQGTANQVLRVDAAGTALAFGQVATAGLTMATTARIHARKTAGAGTVEECTLSEIMDFVGSAAQGDILYRGASTWTRLGAGTSGQVLQTNGAAANPSWATPTGGSGGFLAIQTFTASGSYTPTATMKYCVIECVGGGGGGGGVVASTSQSMVGGGGGSGGYSRVTKTAAQITAATPPISVTIGAAGTAGATSGAAAGNGGNTSVGSLCVANGGNGGTGVAAAAGGMGGGAGGVIAGAAGDITAAGAPGTGGSNISYTSAGAISGGAGGSSFFGGGARGAPITDGSSVVGIAASNYGSGGGGANGSNNATARAGGAGSAGFVIITEYS